MRAKPA